MNVRYDAPAPVSRAPRGISSQRLPLPLDRAGGVPPLRALRILTKKTQGQISRATFYRWLSSGRVFSYRVGYRIYVPAIEIDNIIRQCEAGERF